MPQDSIRTFIALELPDNIKDKIQEIQERIKNSHSVKGSWVIKSNLHLTLKFLGDTKLKYAEGIKEKIRICSQKEYPINCDLNKVGVFPNARIARVVWVGIEGSENQFINLAKKIEEVVFEFGFKKEKRDFKSHITICRPRQIFNPPQFSLLLEEINKDFKPLAFVINKLTFFESQLSPQGSIYTPLDSYLLQP